MKKLVFALILLLTFKVNIFSQPPFYQDIQAFKKQDSLHFPPANAILFVGSSSFTKWTDVSDYFPGYTIINRGFGGSSLPDVIRYADDIIFPYHPKQIFIYCGENDLAASDDVTADTVFNRFKTLYSMIRNKLPATNVTFISLKPSPSRAHLMQEMEKTNALVKGFLSKQKNACFVDVYHAMLQNEKPIPSIFIEDSLHMNAKGYHIWQQELKPFLKNK